MAGALELRDFFDLYFHLVVLSSLEGGFERRQFVGEFLQIGVKGRKILFPLIARELFRFRWRERFGGGDMLLHFGDQIQSGGLLGGLGVLPGQLAETAADSFHFVADWGVLARMAAAAWEILVLRLPGERSGQCKKRRHQNTGEVKFHEFSPTKPA